MKIKFTDQLSQSRLYSDYTHHTIKVYPNEIMEVDSCNSEKLGCNWYYRIDKDGLSYGGINQEWIEIMQENEPTVIKDKPDYLHIFTCMLEDYDDSYRYSKEEKNFVVFFDVNLMDSMSGLREFDQAILNVNTGDLIFMNFSPVFKIETRIIENKSYIIEETIPF